LKRIRPSLATSVLLAVVIIAGLLLATGKLQFRRGQQAEKESTEAAEAQQVRVAGDTVTLDAATFQVSKIHSAPVVTASLPVIFQAPGEVQLSPDRMAHVTPQLAGIVRSVEKNVGDTVAKEGTLCVIESAELGDARASYLGALSERDFAERNYQRWKLLFEKGLRTQNELYAAETDFTRAKIKLESAEARLRALGFGNQDIANLQRNGTGAVSNRYALRSPISGSVLERNVTLGQNVEAKDQLFLVGNLSVVWVQVVAHERDLSQLHAGISAIVRIQATPNASFPGTVTYVGQQVDEKTRTVPIRVVVKNTPSSGNLSSVLRPGMFTTVEMQLSTKRDVPAIPESAAQTESGQSFVFVEIHAGVKGGSSRMYAFQRRPVILGAHSDGKVEIVNGLALGERVVVENAFLLTSEMKKSPVEE
jgi:cobalt-zinc-cadmium efflux system membrane fusion protein